LYLKVLHAFIIEQAGGVSTTGTERVMEITPEDLQQRVPSRAPRIHVEEVIDAYTNWKQ
jgi:fructose-1,6-bisphosphatase